MARDTGERQRARATLVENQLRLQARLDELSRFNLVAVGRELRMIELKREINEMCRCHGEAARQPLDFDQEETPADGRLDPASGEAGSEGRD